MAGRLNTAARETIAAPTASSSKWEIDSNPFQVRSSPTIPRVAGDALQGGKGGGNVDEVARIWLMPSRSACFVTRGQRWTWVQSLFRTQEEEHAPLTEPAAPPREWTPSSWPSRGSGARSSTSRF